MVSSKGRAIRSSSAARSGLSAPGQLADRLLVDLAEPGAARLVERGAAHLVEQLLDHRPDPHDLGRLLDRLRVTSPCPAVGSRAHRRAGCAWDHQAREPGPSGSTRTASVRPLALPRPRAHAGMGRSSQTQRRAPVRAPSTPGLLESGMDRPRHERDVHLGRGERPMPAEQAGLAGVGGVEEGDRGPRHEGDVAQAVPPPPAPALPRTSPRRRSAHACGPTPRRRALLGGRLARRRRRPGGRAASGTGPRPTAARPCSSSPRPGSRGRRPTSTCP